MRIKGIFITAIITLTLDPGISPAQNGAGKKGRVATLRITIPAFPDGGALPRKYGCSTKSKENISPLIQWSGAPAETTSFALILHDPDTPVDFLHWAIFNIPATATGLPEGVPARKMLDDGSVQIKNNDGSIGYSPADDQHFYGCSGQRPDGLDESAHRYEFEVYALDTKLEPAPKDRGDLLNAMKGHIRARGKYSASFQP